VLTDSFNRMVRGCARVTPSCTSWSITDSLTGLATGST